VTPIGAAQASLLALLPHRPVITRGAAVIMLALAGFSLYEAIHGQR
jgi:hypothetical protein